jgi:hypothetical protein
MNSTDTIELDTTYTVDSTNPYYATAIGANGSSAIDWGEIAIGSSYSYSDLEVQGDLTVRGNIMVDGQSLTDVISNIERRLNILRVDPELESRWAELKELGERYRDLESLCLNKELFIKTLKG